MMPAGRRLVFFFVEKEPSYRPNFFLGLGCSLCSVTFLSWDILFI